MEGLEAVGEWTAAMKSEEGREHFLESGGLEQAAQTFKDAVADARFVDFVQHLSTRPGPPRACACLTRSHSTSLTRPARACFTPSQQAAGAAGATMSPAA